ncbi:hypothetical protein B0H10DRAFT_1948893 [Mycena sp. CBHHK59/15]|nr:hypothetical protein B0H10DRAFT_1948893 [Mycena sp. CBHHK59/15]
MLAPSATAAAAASIANGKDDEKAGGEAEGKGENKEGKEGKEKDGERKTRRGGRQRHRPRSDNATAALKDGKPIDAVKPTDAARDAKALLTPRALAAQQLAHVFALHTALLAVGVGELREVDVYAAPLPPQQQEKGRRAGGAGGTAQDSKDAGNLAERISAPFRRTLPALRVGSKWVRGNWAWLAGRGVLVAGACAADSEKETAEGGVDADVDAETALRAQAARFWATYAEFLRLLARVFPVALLPALSVQGEESASDSEEGEDGEEVELELEEDVDMRGWLPLRGLMRGECASEAAADSAGSSEDEGGDGEHGGDVHDSHDGHQEGQRGKAGKRRTVGLKEEVHPNVEHLMRIADLLRDGRRVVGLEGSPLALYGGQFVVKGVEAAKPTAAAGGEVPVSAVVAPVGRLAAALKTPADNLPSNIAAMRNSSLAAVRDSKLASIRDSRLTMRAGGDEEEDAMTEKTSRTDDDILHDAFSFLNNGEAEAAEASDEDQIVWDLRETPVSPLVTVPTARTSPKTPVRPIGPPSKAPTAAITPAPLSPFRTPQSKPITPGTHVPATTALDLLNNFSVPLGKTAAQPALGLATATPAPGGGGGDLLFGSRPLQSIWSASRDEQGLMFSGSGAGASGLGVQQQQQPHQYQGLGQNPGLGAYAAEQQYQQQHPHSHHHQRYASQDLSQGSQSTIWASSYPTAGQHNVPAAGFGVPPISTVVHAPPHQHPHQHHQRVVSNSMAAAQLFPSGGDPYGYGPLVGSAAGQYGDSGGGRVPQESLGVYYASSPVSPTTQFPPSHSHPGQHARHLSLSMHDQRGAFHGQQPVVPMSQLWGNAG